MLNLNLNKPKLTKIKPKLILNQPIIRHVYICSFMLNYIYLSWHRVIKVHIGLPRLT
jgi:hypothetical protein